MKTEDLVLFGSGAVGRLVRQFIEDINRVRERWNLMGFLDNSGQGPAMEADDLPFLGDRKWLLDNPAVSVVVCIAEPHARKRVVDDLLAQGHSNFGTIVHPRAWVADRVAIGGGSIIYPGVLIDVDVQLGRHNILNKASTVGHDTVIGDFVTIAPGANLGGQVTIGQGCDFGINSATIQGLSIGDWVRVGAGAAVVKNLPSHVTAVGVPAKVIKWHLEEASE